jgi:simple sugar transport system ATP-binding protein
MPYKRHLVGVPSEKTVMTVTLKLEYISKFFGANQVLKSVNLEINAGEIHGLVGENGSGKTTLLNIIMGHPIIRDTGGYSGQIWLDGKKAEIQSPGQAIQAGLGMVYQEFALLPGFTAGQNIRFGRESLSRFTRSILPRSLSYIDRKRDHTQAGESLKRLGTDINPYMISANLPINLQQYVEISRETGRSNLRVLILDEPTATLGREDTIHLMSLLKELADTGIAVIFISHKLEEVLEICHRITVLRDGEVVSRIHRNDKEFNVDQVILTMLGKKNTESKKEESSAAGPVIMEFEDWKVDMPGEMIRNLNLQIRQREILGIAGLTGHGKTALGYGLTGMYPATGQVRLDGRRLNTDRPFSALGKDVYFLSDDRRQSGLMLDRPITENVVFTASQYKNRFIKTYLGVLHLIDWASAREYTQKCIEGFSIRCQDVNQPTGELSGGNQQKVCLIRAVTFEPRILFVSEPTRGIDIGARQTVLKALVDLNRESGTSIVCISSEIDDLRQICDRIVVMYDGEITGEISPEANNHEFATALAGKRGIKSE